MVDGGKTRETGGITDAKRRRLALMHSSTGQASQRRTAPGHGITHPTSHLVETFSSSRTGFKRRPPKSPAAPASSDPLVTRKLGVSLPPSQGEQCYVPLPTGVLQASPAGSKSVIQSMSASALLGSFVDSSVVGDKVHGEMQLKVQDKTLLLDNPVAKPSGQRSGKQSAWLPKAGSRTQLKALGLHRKLDKAIRFEDLQALRAHWDAHVQAQLRIDKAPRHWLASAKLLGCELAVVSCLDPRLAGCCGTVVHDSGPLIWLVTRDNIVRTVSKRQATFELDLGTSKMTICGQHWNVSPVSQR